MKLARIEVERVDAVDSPASRHRFVMMKSEDSGASELVKAASDAVTLLSKVEGLPLSADIAKALNDLAKAAEVDHAFKSVEEVEAEKQQGLAAFFGPTFKAEEFGNALQGAVEKALASFVAGEKFAEAVVGAVSAHVEKEAAEMAPVVKGERFFGSKQPADQDEIAKGDKKADLFSNVVFG